MMGFYDDYCRRCLRVCNWPRLSLAEFTDIILKKPDGPQPDAEGAVDLTDWLFDEIQPDF
jgi:hypothetical protein